MNFIDRVLEKIDKQNVSHLYQEGGTVEEIASELNLSKRWVQEMVDEMNFIQERNSECVGCD